MAATTRAIIKGWFTTGKYPTQGQFSSWIDSFFSITEDTIPITSVFGLQQALAGKASIGANLELDFVAADIIGDGVATPYSLDLSLQNIPQFPRSFALYISLTGEDADWQWIANPNYNPVTQSLEGLSSPEIADGYPDQLIKILIS